MAFSLIWRTLSRVRLYLSPISSKRHLWRADTEESPYHLAFPVVEQVEGPVRFLRAQRFHAPVLVGAIGVSLSVKYVEQTVVLALPRRGHPYLRGRLLAFMASLDLVLRQVYAVGHLVYARSAFMFLLKLVQLTVYLVDASHLVEGQAHDSALLSYSLQDALSNPPYGVGDELESTCFVKLLCGFDQSDVSLIDEVGKAESLVLVLLRHGDNKSQIGFG